MRKCVPFMLFFLIEVVGNIDAQIIRKGEWEKFDLSQYTDKRLYVKKYEDAALNIKGFYKSGADGLTVGRSVKIDSIPKTKDELFRNLYSFLSDDDLCHIEEIDKKVGSIRGTVFVENVSSIYRGTNAAPTSVCVMLGFGIDVEDGKIHIEMSIDQYLSKDLFGREEGCYSQTVYPFNKRLKKVISQAFVNSHICTEIFVKKVAEAAKTEIKKKNEPSQIFDKQSIAEIVKARTYAELYDYVQQKRISAPLFASRYGDRFLKDCQSIEKSMRYASEESKLNFQEAIATRQLMVEKNREEWNRLRDINMCYLRAGKALITLSTISAAIAIPVIYKKAGDDYNKGISNIYNGQDYTNELNSIGRRTKGIIITGVVCGLGELAGIFCIARYRTHRDEYDPPFYFTPTLYEESIGFSFMKTF